MNLFFYLNVCTQSHYNKMTDSYRTIEHNATGLFKDKGSKFLAFAYPVTTEEQVKQQVNELKKEYFDARHHCYAYMLGPEQKKFRANDDGEPSGTAGKPILGQIQSKNVTNLLIVVVRYFGGTLLGTGGLINAYKNAAADALESAQIIEKQVLQVYSLHFPYPVINEIMKVLKEEKLDQWDQQFELTCSLKIAIPAAICLSVCEKLAQAGAQLKYIETR